jgi:quinol monooxygenase YgiN
MQSVTQINVIAIKPGKADEFIEAQKRYIASIDLPPGLIGVRMYKSADGKSAVLVAQYESTKALEAVQQRAVLKEHIEKVRPLVESSSPALYEEVYTAGDFK